MTIEVICGGMFSGKTEELIKRIKRSNFSGKKVQVFKPEIDSRYDPLFVNSHSGIKIDAITIKESKDLLSKIEIDTDIIAIDEIQFFDDSIIPIIEGLAKDGIRVIVAGLDLDFKGEPFGIMPKILCVAEFIDKYHAVCVKCKKTASRSQRIIDGNLASNNDPVVLVGTSESYEPRCRNCHINKEQKKVNNEQRINVESVSREYIFKNRK